MHWIVLIFTVQASLWPYPSYVKEGTGHIQIQNIPVFDNEDMMDHIMTSAIKRFTAEVNHLLNLRTSPVIYQVTDLPLKISVNSFPGSKEASTDESYKLSVSSSAGISIIANTTFGVSYALETLIQMFEIKNEQVVIKSTPFEIIDIPRFNHRGLLVDTGRNFIPKETLKTILKGMSMSKLNVFHWHMTGSHSFPYESEAFPELSNKGSYSGKVYTKDDIFEIIGFASELGIRVIPEFNVPSHTRSIALSHPELIVCKDMEPSATFCTEPPCGQLDPTNDKTYALVRGIFFELTKIFIDPYIHIGGDDINLKCWEQSQKIHSFMQNRKFLPANLTNYFALQVVPFIHEALKKKIIVSEELLLHHHVTFIEREEAIVQSYTGQKSIQKMIERGYDVIVTPSPHLFLDCGIGEKVKGRCEGYQTWQKIYEYEPTMNFSKTTTVKDLKHIVGGEAAIWTRMFDETNIISNIFPRVSALGERLWSSINIRNLTAASPRMLAHRERLVRNGILAAPLQPKFCILNPRLCN